MYLKSVIGKKAMGDGDLLIRARVLAHEVGTADNDSDVISVKFKNLETKQACGVSSEVFMQEFDIDKYCEIKMHIPRAKGMDWWFVVDGHYYKSPVGDHPESIGSADEWTIEDANYDDDEPYVFFARKSDKEQMGFSWTNRSERVYRVNFVGLENNTTNKHACSELWETYTVSRPRFFDIHVPSDAAKPCWFDVQLSKRPYECGPCRACPQIPAQANEPKDSRESHHYESHSRPNNIKKEDIWLLMEYSDTASPPCLVLQRQSDSVEMLFRRT